MFKRNQNGQITIFFAIVVVVMITMIAFIINIGIFVKAKINLQNATDAAAYAGASVQARQLTNIAYLNWEMRNTYKEWMFKYYVLGNLNVKGVSRTNPPNCNTQFSAGGGMDFTMCPGQNGSIGTPGGAGAAGTPVTDYYNFPSVCIDFAGTGSVGLCTRYLVPGLPRFKSSNVLGLDETTNAFIDTIVSQKGKDCSLRSELNFLTANTWAYNVIGDTGTARNIRDASPEVAANRAGAFPKAFELALRIRNLEYQMNRRAYSGVCIQTGNSPECLNSIEDITSSGQVPSNERIYKAFFSGFRNLGSEEDFQLRRSFTLTEIPPQEFSSGSTSLSSLLIPDANQTKRYVDLQLMPANYATFYTAFTSGIGDYIANVGGSSETVAAEGQCTATKMALPVPGYPIGFVKNPDVVTYYAVKAEARFIGLFNPFDDPQNQGIKLTAYSAAKPFGGRIGPFLFNTSDNLQLRPRGPAVKRSSPFMLTLDTRNHKNPRTGLADIPEGEYRPGLPLPLNDASSRFWTSVAGAQTVGGFSGSAAAITFGIPNMLYEYPDTSNIETNSDYYAKDGEVLQGLSALDTGGTRAGLYNTAMFEKLRSKLVGIGGVVTVQNIDNAISMARAPTVYESHNYLVPTPEDVNAREATDSFGPITNRDADNTVSLSDGTQTYRRFRYRIYAPLFGDPSVALYLNAGSVDSLMGTYLSTQRPAIDKYVESMSLAAQQIYNNVISTNTNQNLGIEAANGISDIPAVDLASNNPANVVGKKPTCQSIAGQFAYYYLGEDSGVGAAGCPDPFREILISRWSTSDFSENYEIEYVLPNDVNLQKRLFSGYRPGIEHDAENGVQTSARDGSTDIMVRNSYSTKFVSLSSLTAGVNDSYGQNISTASEGGAAIDGEPTSQRGFRNPLQVDSVNLDLSRVRY